MLRLSVLLPVRNARPWLGASLASLWRQTERDFEVIAVDDGSSDGSGEWLEAAARHEPRLRVLHTPPRGLPAALNLGLAQARARWIGRHDADDLSHRTRFARQLARAAHAPRADVIGARVRLFADGNPRLIGEGMRRWIRWHNRLLDHEAIRREMLIDSPLAHGSALVRRDALEAVGGWAEQGWAEDLDLWIRMAEAGARFTKCPEVLYAWRQHRGSATRTDPRYARERFTALKVAALGRTLLRAPARATLVGTGASLQRWRDTLGTRVREVVSTRQVGIEPLRTCAPPYVLVYVASSVRDRWRVALHSLDLHELRHFAFVS